MGNTTRVNLYVSNVTGWNAAAGNTSIQMRGAPISSVSHVLIPAATVTTETGGALYNMSTAAGIPFLSIGFGTATSGAGTITVICDGDGYQ